MQKKAIVQPETMAETPDSGKYTVKELCFHSAQLFLCKPEVVEAALGNVHTLTIEVAKEKIETFLKREVKK